MKTQYPFMKAYSDCLLYEKKEMRKKDDLKYEKQNKAKNDIHFYPS